MDVPETNDLSLISIEEINRRINELNKEIIPLKKERRDRKIKAIDQAREELNKHPGRIIFYVFSISSLLNMLFIFFMTFIIDDKRKLILPARIIVFCVVVAFIGLRSYTQRLKSLSKEIREYNEKQIDKCKKELIEIDKFRSDYYSCRR